MIEPTQILSQIEEERTAPAETILEDCRILFADESQELLGQFELCTNKLHWSGVFVRTATQMMDAINNLLNVGLHLDAIVADISYNENITGITAAREARKAMPNVPIIFVSTYVTSIIREEVRRVDAEIIQKPFDVTTLFIRLSQLIYWNRLATDRAYAGENNRHNSINRTGHSRRVTDYVLSTPDRISQTLKERDKNERR